MSYGYAPSFSPRAIADLRRLDGWLQEEVLDEVDRLVASLPVPTPAQRLNPDEVTYDSVRTVGTVQHYLFISTELDVGARLMRVTRVGHHRSP